MKAISTFRHVILINMLRQKQTSKELTAFSLSEITWFTVATFLEHSRKLFFNEMFTFGPFHISKHKFHSLEKPQHKTFLVLHEMREEFVRNKFAKVKLLFMGFSLRLLLEK